MGDCRGERHGGLNTGGTVTAKITVRAGQRGRPGGAHAGRGEAGASGGTGKTWGLLVGHVQQYQEAYEWEGAD